MRELLNHGQDGHYQHVRLGVNGRMDSMQAAVLREKLSILDDELTQRQLLADRYNELLQELAGQCWSKFALRTSRKPVRVGSIYRSDQSPGPCAPLPTGGRHPKRSALSDGLVSSAGISAVHF